MALQQAKQMRRIGLGITLDAFDEMPQQQAFFAADRMYAHHRMLGLVNGRGEDLAIALQLLRRHVRFHGSVVVFVAVHGHQFVRQLAQFGRQFVVRRRGVGPEGIATECRSHHRAQDRGFRVGIDEGHVGVPGVGALPFGAVQFQQIPGALTGRHGRVRHRLAEQMGKGFLTLIVELRLLAEE